MRLHGQRHNANSRAAQLGLPGRLSIRDVEHLPRECVYCGAIIDLQLDHATPLSRGGANAWWNLTVACAKCNRAKWGRTVAEFLAERAA